MTRYQPFQQPFLAERVRQRCIESPRSQTEMVWGQESMDNNNRPKGAGSGKAGTEVPVKLGSSIETVQEVANWLYHLVYESLLAMTTMCS